MIEKQIAALEVAINKLEEKIDSDDFQDHYDNLKVMEETTEMDIDSLPYDTATDSMIDKFDSYRKRFLKCKKQIKRLENEHDLDAGDDSSWMFDEEENDF